MPTNYSFIIRCVIAEGLSQVCYIFILPYFHVLCHSDTHYFCLYVCLRATGSSAVLQPDHHAATDVGVLQTAPGEQRWGVCMCLHICVCHCIPGCFQSAYYLWSSDGNTERSLPVKIDLMFELGYLSLIQALCLCNLWKKKPGFFSVATWHPAAQRALCLSGCNITDRHEVAAAHCRSLTLYAAAQGVWLSGLGSHAGCGE